MAVAVKLDAIAVRHADKAILHDLSLDVRQGEFLVLLGASGCGKTTLLNAIAGLHSLSEGEVWIAARNVTDLPPKARNIAMVFQDYALYPTMSVRRNMSFALKVVGVSRREVARRVADVADMLQLDHLLDQMPGQLSGGQKQRVAIGRALVKEAPICLFDEPFSNLDSQLRMNLRSELKTVHQRLTMTMVFVTHDQVEAMALADRIAVMRDGQIEQVGTPLEIYRHPQTLFVAKFVGLPRMNIIDGTLTPYADGYQFVGGGLNVAFDAASFARPPQSGQDVCLGIRPEHVSLGDGRFEATIDQMQKLGASDLVEARVDGNPFQILADERLSLSVKSSIRFDIKAADAHIFDGAGEALLRRLPVTTG